MRSELEGSLGGENLGDVRVHTDAAAAGAAQDLGAKAFTVGQAIYFNEGQFDPGSQAGKELIGHEVAHTVQQRGAGDGDPQLASLDVSSPGDSHEQEAEAFGSSFASGKGGGKVTPVSKGAIQRAVIQRDLLDGGPPAELVAPPAPINAEHPSSSELAQHAGQALRDARANGGTQAVIAMVHRLRSQASGQTSAAVESAIGSELTQAERDALEGKQTTQSKNAPVADNHPGGAQQPNKPAVKTGGDKQLGDKNGANTGGEKPGEKPADKNGANKGEKNAAQNGAENANAEAEKAGANPSETHKTDSKETPGKEAAKPAHPTTSNTEATSAETHPAATAPGGGPEGPHPEPPKVSEAGGRELIEQELAFHEKWAAYSKNGAAGRALNLLSAQDIGQGVVGGMTQFVLGQGTKLLTSETALGRIPGVGNIIGGAFSAYALFSHGGAGIKEMGHEISEGIGGAFKAENWSESPWLTAANLVAGIKGVLELVGNVCQILSGLAYAFAAIAALGGLLSIFFPPLAILLPYIPMAINFGRACGGIATVCMSVASLISPIPPILRAMHLIFSNNDPVKLVAQDQKFHKEVQGAIASYSAAKLNSTYASRMDPKTPDRGAVGGMLHEAGEGVTQVKTSVQSNSVENVREGLGMSDARLKNAQVESVVGKDTKNAHQIGKEYFNPDLRQNINVEGAEKAKDAKNEAEQRRDGRQDNVTDAEKKVEGSNTRGNRRELGLAQKRLEQSSQKLETAESKFEMAEAKADAGGRNASSGNAGDTGDLARGRLGENLEEPKKESANEAYKELRHGQEPVEPTKDAKGHVELPEPPGDMQQIEAMDHQIEELRKEEKQLAANAAKARTASQHGATAAAGLVQASAGVQQKLTAEQTRSQQEQTKIGAQTADLREKTTTASTNAAAGTQKGAGALSGIATTARVVDGIVQKVPSNKFFNVDSTKKNVHQFVVGMDQITGAPGKQQQQQQQTQAATEARTAQVQQASAANHAGVASGQQLTGQMTQDAATARGVASSAGEVAAASTQGAQQAGSKAQQLQQQREAKWNALLEWAARHRAIRETAAHE